MRFGKQLHLVNDGDTVRITERQFVNWDNVRNLTINSETVRVKDHQQVLTEFLKLLDEQKAGIKHCVGLQTVEDKDGNIIRVERIWSEA